MTTPYDGRVTQDTVASIDAVVRAEMERCRQPGAAVGLTDADRTLAVRTYGLADLASQRLVGPDTLFEVGSIGKSFTAILALRLDRVPSNVRTPGRFSLPIICGR